MAGQIARWRFRIKSQTLVPSVECRVIYGLSPDAPLSFSYYLDAVHPDDREMQRKTLAAAIERTGKYDLEHRIRRADGSVHRVRIMGSLTYEDDAVRARRRVNANGLIPPSRGGTGCGQRAEIACSNRVL